MDQKKYKSISIFESNTIPTRSVSIESLTTDLGQTQTLQDSDPSLRKNFRCKSAV